LAHEDLFFGWKITPYKLWGDTGVMGDEYNYSKKKNQ
jgi:hypothetical protein